MSFFLILCFNSPADFLVNVIATVSVGNKPAQASNFDRWLVGKIKLLDKESVSIVAFGSTNVDLCILDSRC